MQALAHAAEHFAQARGLRRGDAERVCHALFVEPQQFSRGCGGAERARRSRDMPATRVMPWINAEAHATRDFDAQKKCMQKIFARDRRAFREREDGRTDHAACVYHRLQMRIAEREHIRADAVHECREQDVHALAPAEHRCDARTGKFLKRRQRALDGFVPTAAERAAEPVQQRALRLVRDRVWNISGT